ncbi:MAG: hypothetical protein HY860_04485 [Chlamydiales bacterium]|nr:hypothetical protein [Chlamydiales bacterium]
MHIPPVGGSNYIRGDLTPSGPAQEAITELTEISATLTSMNQNGVNPDNTSTMNSQIEALNATILANPSIFGVSVSMSIMHLCNGIENYMNFDPYGEKYTAMQTEIAAIESQLSGM